MNEQQDFSTPEGNGLRHFARLNSPAMTAAELAKMLEGWPEGTRPKMDLVSCCDGYEQAFSVTQQMIQGFSGGGSRYTERATIPTEAAIDLACMAGLRWIQSQKVPDAIGCTLVTTYDRCVGYRDWEPLDTRYGVVVGYYNDARERVEAIYEGPTLLHAIDAAVRGTMPK